VKQAQKVARGSARRDGGLRPALAHRDFPGLRGIVFLNAASMGMASVKALAAIEAQRRLLAAGPHGQRWAGFVERFERGIDAARSEAARLLRAHVDEVGLISDTTAGLHQALDAIPFREGDNVVLSDLEYPQVALAAENVRRELGVELRFVAHRAGRVTVDDYRPAIDRRTRALLLSSVGWVTGERLDLASLSQLAEERGFFLVVDAVQHLGGVSLDCSTLGIDFLTSGGYKWLNAPFGCGVFYVRRGVHARGLRVRRVGILGLEEPQSGWGAFYASPEMKPLPDLAPTASVRRFEAQGTPNRLGAAGLAAALRHRNGFGRRAVDHYILDLGGELIEELHARRAQIWTPHEPAARAGIITFTFGRRDASVDERLRSFLERRSIFTTVRYCSGVGGVRVAVHLFNTRTDIAALLAALDTFPR
jgi:selenocysteine lyase/cysteine desulfurase